MECRIPSTSRVLKDCAEELAEPLTLLFKQSLEEGQLPAICRNRGKKPTSHVSSKKGLDLVSVAIGQSA